jgi:hypothetical protein
MAFVLKVFYGMGSGQEQIWMHCAWKPVKKSGMVAHICNSSYTGDRERRITVQDQPGQNV